MLGFYVLLEDPDANVIIALALHSALLQLGFLKVMTYTRSALVADQPRPLASGENAAANRRCWSSYNSCQCLRPGSQQQQLQASSEDRLVQPLLSTLSAAEMLYDSVLYKRTIDVDITS